MSIVRLNIFFSSLNIYFNSKVVNSISIKSLKSVKKKTFKVFLMIIFKILLLLSQDENLV